MAKAGIPVGYLMLNYTRFASLEDTTKPTKTRVTTTTFPADVFEVITLTEKLYEERIPKKSIATVARLLSDRLGCSIVGLDHKQWIYVRNVESQTVTENPTANDTSGGGYSGTNATIYPDYGEEREVPEAQIDGGQTPLVETQGLPLVEPMGKEVRTVATHWPSYKGERLKGDFALDADRFYNGRKIQKHLTDAFEHHIFKESGKYSCQMSRQLKLMRQ